MRIVSKNPVIVAGLTGVLALGVAGCSFSSESSTTTTVESTITDEDGNTTTTTETTTVTSGTGTQDAWEAEGNGEEPGHYYENDYYGVAFVLPEGFESSSVQTDVQGEEIDYYASDSDGNDVKFVLTNGVTQLEGITDEDSWAEAWGASFQNALAENGDTDIEVESAAVTIGDLPVAGLHVESTSEGNPVYRDVYFLLDEDGDGMRIIVTAFDEDALQTMRDAFRSTTA